MGSQTKRAPVRTRTATRVHSIHVLLRGDEFVGQIDTPQKRYDCRFRPSEGRIVNGRLELGGTFGVIGTAGRPRTADSVTATLAALQAGVGAPPGAPLNYTTRIKLAIEGATALPITESTDASGYAGVLYFHLSPLDGRELGVSCDLSKVQLNVRLAPVSQGERELQWLLSALSGTLLGSTRNETLAEEYLADINRRLKM